MGACLLVSFAATASYYYKASYVITTITSANVDDGTAVVDCRLSQLSRTFC